MLTIIDYGVGNLASIKNMLKKIGHRDVVVSGKEEDILRADKLILPGVGHFDYGMNSLLDSGLVDVLNQRVLEDKIPILGICLGAQLLTKGSEEGTISGLGWIDAHTVSFDKEKLGEKLKVPHMGWSEVLPQNNTPLFEGMHEFPPRFYFVHSYHLVCTRKEDVAVITNYGYEFAAGMIKENIIGMQFHPEKSHKFGMKLLDNFMNHY